MLCAVKLLPERHKGWLHRSCRRGGGGHNAFEDLGADTLAGRGEEACCVGEALWGVKDGLRKLLRGVEGGGRCKGGLEGGCRLDLNIISKSYFDCTALKT